MRRTFKTRTFTRWSRKAGVSDAALRKAIEEMSVGLIDADLGGSVFKKRVRLPGRGKRGSARVLIATKPADHWYFLYGTSNRILMIGNWRRYKHWRTYCCQ